MLPRSLLIVLTGFWLTMNVLLWRAEYGGRPGLGSSVPARVVWDKILTAPDSSSLTIFRRGKKIGFCHWITSVGEDLSRLSAAEAPPEGMVGKIVNYRLELDGNLALGDSAERLRFDSHLTLGGDEKWQDFELRVNLRPSSWEIRSAAAQKTVRLNGQDEMGQFQRVYKFSDFENPEALLQEFAGPFAAGLLSGLGLPSLRDPKAIQALGLHWEARHESVKLGHSAVRAYRLEARLLDRFAIVVFVSRVGEILRVELPEGVTLTNDQLGETDPVMIELEHLVKKFGNLVAVDDVNLTVSRSEFFAVLGPNAAGKTTTLKILAGLMKPTAGCARVGGFDVQQAPAEARRRMAFVPDFPFLYEKLTPREFFRFTGQLFNLSEQRLQHNLAELIARFNLEPYADKSIEGLSHGTRQRVAIVSALSHDPEAFIIDEPMVGLDPQHARVVKDILKERARAGMAVLLSTHQLSVAEEMADRIGIMHQGRLIAVGTRDELRRKSGEAGPLEDVFLALTKNIEPAES